METPPRTPAATWAAAGVAHNPDISNIINKDRKIGLLFALMK